MDWNSLPAKQPEVLAAIDTAYADGPSVIADLAVLCLYGAGLVENPHLCYTGPTNEKPLEYLQRVMEALLVEEKGPGNYPSFHSSQVKDYPKPQLPQRAKKVIDSSVGQQWVAGALQTANKENWPFPRHTHRCKALVELWRSGVAESDLQPLTAAVLDNALFLDDRYGWFIGEAVKALMYIGEWERSIKLIESVPITTEAGVRRRIEGIKLLVETARPDLARAMLDELMEQQPLMPKECRDYALIRMAEAWAYLGEATLARQLHPTKDTLFLEGVIALGEFYASGVSNPETLTTLLDTTLKLEPPKYRVSVQREIMETLLAIGAYEAGWKALNRVEETLLATPLWGKREHRTHNVVQGLFPYLSDHSAPIFSFAASLLISTSKAVGKQDSDFWNIVFVVSGLRWLIRYWAGPAEVARMVTFLGLWQDHLRGRFTV